MVSHRLRGPVESTELARWNFGAFDRCGAILPFHYGPAGVGINLSVHHGFGEEARRQSHRKATFAQIEFAADSSLEGDGFELLVPRHESP